MPDNNDEMTNPEASDNLAEAPESETPPSADTPGEMPPKETTITADQALDIAFGVGVLAVEAATKLAKQLGERLHEVQEQAPAISEALQEKGRPVREKFVGKLKEPLSPAAPLEDSADLSPMGETEGDTENGGTVGEIVSSEAVSPAVTKTNGGGGSSFLSNIFGLGGNKSVSAEDEINALEQRVRELEQEVMPPSFPAAEFSSSPTPAEEATFNPTPPLETLDESSYAMSETDDEVLAEQVEESIDLAASADDTPAKPKVSRRKNSSGISSGSEESADASPVSEGEDAA